MGDVGLAVMLASAVVGFALARKEPAAWLLLVPLALSLGPRLGRLPPVARAVLPVLAWALLAAVVFFHLFWSLYPLLPDAVVRLVPLVSGYGLCLLATVFHAGRSQFSPARTVIPAALGALLCGALDVFAPVGLPVAGAGAGGFLYLVSGFVATPPAHRGRGRRVRRLVAFAGAAAGIALGIARLLPWAQPHVERAAARLGDPPATSYSGLAFDSRLGDIQELKLSRRVVMRVWTGRPQKLRARVFTRFDGQAWHAPTRAGRELAFTAPPPPPGLEDFLGGIPGRVFLAARDGGAAALSGTSVQSRIVQRVFNEGALVSPPRPLLVRAPVTSLWLDATGVLVPPRGTAIEMYGIVNRWHPPDGPVVSDVPPDRPETPVPDDEMLAVPANTDPRLREIARRLAADAPSPDLRLLATLAFLERECRYSLDVGAFHSRQPVAEFVLEKKRGYCEYFASAAAVLLRLGGVPARYVKGFEVRDGNRLGDHYVVREADAHAWVDVYLPGRGWMEADPTPAAEYEETHAGLGTGPWASALEWVSATLMELRARLGLGDIRSLVEWLWGRARVAIDRIFGRTWPLGLVFLIGLAIVRAFRRTRLGPGAPRARRRSANDPTAAELLALVRRLDAAFERRGLRRPPSRAPLEHLDAVPPAKVPPELLAAGRRVVDCYYRARFGGAAIAPAEIATLDAQLRHAVGD
jgi:transglutaminase-like putative cysteine protease